MQTAGYSSICSSALFEGWFRDKPSCHPLCSCLVETFGAERSGSIRNGNFISNQIAFHCPHRMPEQVWVLLSFPEVTLCFPFPIPCILGHSWLHSFQRFYSYWTYTLGREEKCALRHKLLSFIRTSLSGSAAPTSSSSSLPPAFPNLLGGFKQSPCIHPMFKDFSENRWTPLASNLLEEPVKGWLYTLQSRQESKWNEESLTEKGYREFHVFCSLFMA